MNRMPGIVEFAKDIELTDDEVKARITALTIENAQLRAQGEQLRQKMVDRMVQDILKSRQRH